MNGKRKIQIVIEKSCTQVRLLNESTEINGQKPGHDSATIQKFFFVYFHFVNS